jgi:AmmeMemoRadiSam system protein B
MRWRKEPDVSVRRAAVAGLFYPGDERELRSTVRSMLAATSSAGKVPKAIIAPHAGYIYSGPIAASVYALVGEGRSTIRRVILLGPAHRVPVDGLAVSSAREFASPLGSVSVDRKALAQILELPQVRSFDAAHAGEHSLEVHLPFLQEVLDEFTLVPLVVGDATAAEVAEVLELLWGGPETLIVVSSDLSHYLSYEQARTEDGATASAIEQLRPQDIAAHQACGGIPVKGLLLAAKAHGLEVTTLDLRNSGDTAGARDQVVGYGAFAFA